MTSKPFDPNKPYCRRDGKPAKIVYEGEKRYCYLTIIKGDERFCVVNKNTGRTYEAHTSSTYSCDHDLINIPEKIEGWQNIYRVGSRNIGGVIFNTREDALDENIVVGGKVVACIKVSFTEGDGLSND